MLLASFLGSIFSLGSAGYSTGLPLRDARIDYEALLAPSAISSRLVIQQTRHMITTAVAAPNNIAVEITTCFVVTSKSAIVKSLALYHLPSIIGLQSQLTFFVPLGQVFALFSPGRDGSGLFGSVFLPSPSPSLDLSPSPSLDLSPSPSP